MSKPLTEPPKVTPTQDLILNVLTARYRLGDALYTFDTSNLKAAEGLASLGLVSLMHGVTEKTLRASLTDRGMALYMSATALPPVFDKKYMSKEQRKAWPNKVSSEILRTQKNFPPVE